MPSIRLGNIRAGIQLVLPDIKTSTTPLINQFFHNLNGRMRLLITTGASNSLYQSGETLTPIAIPYRASSLDVAYSYEVTIQLTLTMDGQPTNFPIKLRIEREPGGDRLTLLQAGSAVTVGTQSITVIGLRGSTSSDTPTPSRLHTSGVSEFTYRLVISLGRTLLNPGGCEEEYQVFNAENCGCDPICLPDLSDLVEDCEILPPLPPVVGCQEIPVPPPPPVVGPPPETGPPGTPGTPGIPGTPGQNGQDGCSPQIIWTSQVIKTWDCTLQGTYFIVTPIPPCHYWVHAITYVCKKDDYKDRNCCEFIYCDDEWRPLYPSTTYGDADQSNQYFRTLFRQSGGIAEDCETLTTLWTAQTLEYPHPFATPVATGAGTLYWAMCAASDPSTDSIPWYNTTAELLASSLGDTIERITTDPVCCLPGSNYKWSPYPENEDDPCEDISPPEYEGEPGEVVLKCVCEEPCEPEGYIWSIRIVPGDPLPSIGMYVGPGINSEFEDATAYYELCAEETPEAVSGNSWYAGLSESLALLEGDSFSRRYGPPECCDDPPDPPDPCEPGTIWSVRVVTDSADDPPAFSVFIGFASGDSGHKYYARCSETTPLPLSEESWSAMSPDSLATSLGQTIDRENPDPNCCEPPTTAPPEGLLCDGVVGLFGTGVASSESTPKPGGGECFIDAYWKANGDPAIQYVNINIGCANVTGVTLNCNNPEAVEPGGPTGFEAEYSTTFTILEGTDIDRLKFSGTFTADNYVVANGWKVNGVDIPTIEHGAYTNQNTLGCVPFTFTNETANLVVGENTIAITVKNGNVHSGPYGGPTFLKLTIGCSVIDDDEGLPEI